MYRARLDGTEVTVLSGDAKSVWNVAIDADNVYFVVDGGRRLKAVPKAGGPTREVLDAETVATGQRIESFIVDPAPGGVVFMITAVTAMRSGKRVRKDFQTSFVAKAGGPPTTVTSRVAPADLVGLDGTNVFYTTGSNDLIREPRTLAGPHEKAGEFSLLAQGTCRQSRGGRLCCQAREFRCLDAVGKSLVGTTCDKEKLSGATLVSVEQDDAIFASLRPSPRLLRCDLRSGKTSSAMKLVPNVEVRGAVVRGANVYGPIELGTAGAIVKASP